MKLLTASSMVNQHKIPFFFKEKVCLYEFATTKQDKKKNLFKMPKDGARVILFYLNIQLMDANDFKELADGKTNEN